MTGEINKALRIAGVALVSLLAAMPVRAEVILQFFNNSWQEIIDKMPEIAEVGYTALWLPPPQKASGDLSVGYDLWDPFDIGGNPQRTGGRTRYGTEEELLRLIATAHRFGIRVYFDNIMNHRAFDIPGYNENVPVDIYPGMLPEDFHLQVTEEGFYRPWGDTVNWGSTWEVQNQFLSGLIDIAHESPNSNFGPTLGSTHPTIRFVRHPNNPEFYDYHPTLGHVGFGDNGITTQLIAENPEFFKEDVGGYQMRAIRWLVHTTKLDGLRLDAVKHVPAYFFGEQWAADKDGNSNGYIGQAQWQYNHSRGFSDWDNHRDTVFDTEQPRDDLMVFGEHMGEPPPYGEYFAAGMRLLDAKTHSTLNNLAWLPNLGILEHSDYVEGQQFGKNLGVYYAKSHDDDVAYGEHLHYANHLTRAGLPNIYTDGNRQAETLGGSGGAFPRHANTRPFGQFGDNRIPNLVQIHNAFARGSQHGRLGSFDTSVVAYERRDKRENQAMTDGDATTLFFMMNRNWDAGEYREIDTAFPDGAWLWQYASGSANFYHQVTDGKIKVTVPPAGYFAFSWRSPEESDLWKFAGGKPITIYDNGREPGWVSYERVDGPDGDPGFNPYGLPDDNGSDFRYTYFVPRITSPTNISFVARVDGSAHNVMFKLDGGVPLNNINHAGGDARDNPPALSTDVYLGYEQADFVRRIGPEKFASRDSTRNKIGSPGAETYQLTVGTNGFTYYDAAATNDWDGAHTAVFVYHNPEASTDPNPQTNSFSQFWPPPQDAADSPIYFWVKSGEQGDVNRIYIYYTTDGVSWPEGAGGVGLGSTKVAEVYWQFNAADGNDWWGEGFIPPQPAGTTIRYKIGASREQGYADAPWDVVFPNSWNDIQRKTKMMGVWQIANFSPAQSVYRPHNDYGHSVTGLVEGFHHIKARAFLQRDGAEEGNGQRAAIYNTFHQTFYLDTKAPEGEIKFPIASQTLYDNRYEFVVRTDPTVTKVWFNVQDGSALNDDGQTGQQLGNGTNALGQASWVAATRVNPSININSSYPLEWRFSYNNIPASGNAMVLVKLAEASSSTNPLVADEEGRFTTLSRLVNAAGPDLSMFVAWPQNDGDTIGSPYDMKVRFSKAMMNADEATIRNRFLVNINGLAQDRDTITFNYDASDTHHEMVFPLPDLWNGDPNYLHEIEVVHTNAAGGGVILYADRRVRAAKSSTAPVVSIIDPPQFNLDGAPYQVILPDVANPAPTQRQHGVKVQTGPEVQSVWITFTNSTGTTVPEPSSTNALSGTVNVTAGSKIVGGSNTAFSAEVSAGSILQIATSRVVVAQVVSTNQLLLVSDYPGATASGLAAQRIQGNPIVVGNKLFWSFTWTGIEEGLYTLVANADSDGNPATIEARAFRTTRVFFRQRVEFDANDPDNDDDGLLDYIEGSPTNLPATNPESWNNGEVHIWVISGRSDGLSPDSDGDGLPDGLELGWGGAIDGTDTATDTNGDGWPNFIGDTDPPIYNTFDNQWHPRFDRNKSRTDQLGGSLTDPGKTDTDSDQLDDSLEDLNRNGRVDIGLLTGGAVTEIMVYPNIPTVYNTSQVDGNALPVNARFLETDPNNADTDGDGVSDGFEDGNRNGRVDLALLYPAGTSTPFVVNHTNNSQYLLGGGQSGIRSRALDYAKLFTDFPRPTYDNGTWSNTNAWPRLLVLETDPLRNDTNGDGLPDGWKIKFGLDPFDDGWYNLRTGEIHPVNSQQGSDGDITGDGVNNLQHLLNGTDPRVDINIPVPVGSINIGAGPVIGQLNGQDIYEEFMEWTWDDLLALDYYEGDGPNNKQGDTFPAWDGYDTSRDLTAFYVRDGGAIANGGDDKVYFRIDFYDLQAFAEEGNMDLYVVIDTGNTAIGERNLPDDIDTGTDMRWEVVVAVYDSAVGTVYVDTDPEENTSLIGDDLASIGKVVSRGDYFLGAYFNAELDAVEFAIKREALLDVQWNGNPNSLNFQVYATKDGTCNGCEDGGPGPGDLGGRSDIRDSIYNNWIAEDYWELQAGLAGPNSILREWIPGSSRPGRAKLSHLVHGNQTIQPGSVMQALVNNNAGAGYYRVLDTHEVLAQALNLHITPTLASAIQWAEADPAANMPWIDGPSLNARIGELARTNLVALLAGTFSDSPLPYLTPDYLADNEALAREFIETIYGIELTTNSVFWTPERILDRDALEKIASLGYRATVLDQMEHLFTWFGRTAALGTRGYQINRIDGVETFAINNGANDFRFDNHDGGLSMPLRRLFNRKARGDQDQVVVLMSNWEDFTSKSLSDAYDVNMQWIANRPWIESVTLESILTGEVDLSGDGIGDTWYVEDRGTIGAEPKLAHNWINYASQMNYDHWYVGSSLNEGLFAKVFESRPGQSLPQSYGMLYSPGIVTSAWAAVKGVTQPDLGPLARGTLHASVFQTAFHEQGDTDLRKYSNGEYIEPDVSSNRLATFAKVAQSQSRMAAVYGRVNTWLAGAAGLNSTVTEALDVDLDGEAEYILYNRRVFALFERMGGRLVAAWHRDDTSGRAHQMIGNLTSYAGFENETEGEFNVFTNGVVRSYRTSALKDWWAGTTAYVNDLYSFENRTNGWRIVSADGKIVKTVSLEDLSNWLIVNYSVDPSLNGGTLYVRHGLSPDLGSLLLHGQKYLGTESHAGGNMTLTHAAPDSSASVIIAYASSGHTAVFNENAVDDDPGGGVDFATRRMRNQAQTHQVELSGTGNFSFAIGFEANAGVPDTDGDGIPDAWENQYFGGPTNATAGAMAANGVNTVWESYIAGLDPTNPSDVFEHEAAMQVGNGVRVRFATKNEREYLIWYADNNLVQPTWYQASTNRIQGTGSIYEWLDDGTETTPHPTQVTSRYYRIEVDLP